MTDPDEPVMSSRRVREALNTFDEPERIYVRELVNGEWTHSLAELPGDKAVAHTIRLLRRVLLGDDNAR
jgi:hypothetical protein